MDVKVIISLCLIFSAGMLPAEENSSALPGIPHITAWRSRKNLCSGIERKRHLLRRQNA